MAENENEIDKIYIDISVKNTGLNTLQTATNNLKDVVNNINLKGVDVSVTNNTLSTITTLSKLYKQLSQIERITSKNLSVNIETKQTSKEKKVSNKVYGLQSRSRDSISTTYDAYNKQLSQITQQIAKDGFITKTTSDAYGKITKQVEEYTDILGNKYVDIYDKTKDLTNGITKSNYVINENGKEWKQNYTHISQTKDGLEKVTKTFDELGNEIKSTTTLTDQYGNVVSKTLKNKVDTADKSINNINNTISNLKNGIVGTISKITIFGYGISKLSSTFKNFVQISNEYVENLNLFRVTFGKMANEAEDFVNMYSSALGLDPSQVMRNMGFFNQIVTGFGVSSDEGYKMSKLLTQFAYDLSSFVNIDVEDAMLKFQSGIAGELEPLRRVGYALDEATLQQIAYNNGITKSIRTMTQAEKTYLRLIAMYEQSANVMGDLGATITSPANALRILQQQFLQLKRSIGNTLSPIITKLIPIVQGATKALTEFFNLLAEKMGYEVEGARENAYVEYMDNITSSAKEAENAINGTLLSFDKFSVLGSQSTEDDNFTLPIPEYDALATLVDTLAETSSSYKKTYDLISGIFMNADRSDLSNSLKAILELINAIWEAIEVTWNNFISPVLIPTLKSSLEFLTGYLSKTLKILDSAGLLKPLTILILFISLITKMKPLLSTTTIFISGLINVSKKLFITLKGAIVGLYKQIVSTLPLIKNALVYLFGSIQNAFTQLSAGLVTVIALYIEIKSVMDSWADMNTAQRIVSIAGILATAFFGLAIAIGAFHSAWSLGLAIAGMVAGIATVTAMVNSAKKDASTPVAYYATGGFTPETSGSLFMAGENGRPELMGTIRGKNAVANVNSIETAMENASYRGMVTALNESNRTREDNKDIVLQIDGKELARANVRNNANALSKNYRIELNPR